MMEETISETQGKWVKKYFIKKGICLFTCVHTYSKSNFQDLTVGYNGSFPGLHRIHIRPFELLVMIINQSNIQICKSVVSGEISRLKHPNSVIFIFVHIGRYLYCSENTC